MSITLTQTIQAPLKQVFLCLDDAEKIRQWRTHVVGIKYLSGRRDAPEPGQRFKQKSFVDGLLEEQPGEIIYHQRPSCLMLRFELPRGQLDVRCYLIAIHAHQTRLRYEVELTRDSAWMKLSDLCLGWLRRWLLRRQLRALKRVAEAEAEVRAPYQAVFNAWR